jgi:hypothetical protein
MVVRKEYDKSTLSVLGKVFGNMLKKTKADEAEVPFQDFIEGVCLCYR